MVADNKTDSPIAVLKFGGTSLADGQRIRRAGEVIQQRVEAGFSVVAVVSAQASITDRLISQARELSSEPDLRELDLLLSSGERISAALVSIRLNSVGVRAIGLTGSQAGIITDTNHSRATIVEIRPYRIQEALLEGKVVVVGGFQGVSNLKEITTLGRGGSDITAVALANALEASRCEILSDVDGIYSADPRVVPDARKLERISFPEMEELARAGAQVLHPQAVTEARLGGTPIHALTSFEPHATGTIISDLETRRGRGLTGIASRRDITWVQARTPPNELLPGLQESGLELAGFWSSAQDSQGVFSNFLVPGRENVDRRRTLRRIEQVSQGFRALEDLCLVTLVGEGKCESAWLISDVGNLLRQGRISLLHFEAHPNRIRCLLPDSNHDTVVQMLHDRFLSD